MDKSQSKQEGRRVSKSTERGEREPSRNCWKERAPFRWSHSHFSLPFRPAENRRHRAPSIAQLSLAYRQPTSSVKKRRMTQLNGSEMNGSSFVLTDAVHRSDEKKNKNKNKQEESGWRQRKDQLRASAKEGCSPQTESQTNPKSKVETHSTCSDKDRQLSTAQHNSTTQQHSSTRARLLSFFRIFLT